MVNGLTLEDVCVDLHRKRVIDKVSLTIQPGQMMALVGPNGAGKSTLLRAALGLIGLAGGAVRLDGRPLAQFDTQERARRVAYLPQGHQTVWPVPVARVVGLGRLPHRGPFAAASPADAAAVAQAMAQTDITHLADRPVSALSGGERARVLLARALAVGAGVLLADEPISALDPRHQLEVMALLRAAADSGTAVVCVLHDLGLAARFCHSVAVLDHGRLVAEGPPDTALSPAILRGVYGVEPYSARHEQQPVLIPWRVLS
ncbi:ABC transporter ATP-binding protein [Paracoccus sp. p4-l81]|uniref:ABC transporter ATP-binding protein n=1 Tax=unclassified Paracoccus (in: a-proteobacteria) TaxID=2688777 RepID=UPI0035B77468